MNLTTTEKYALTVLEAYGKLTALQKQERALCLTASCIWDMIQAKALTANEKGKLTVSAPLPETLSYCGPLYKRLAKKSMKPEKAALDYVYTNKRIKTLVKSITDDLIDRSVLVLEQKSSLLKAGLCHVDTAVIAEDIAAVKHMDQEITPEQTNLAVLLLESGTAKKMMNKQELSVLKKAVKQVNSDFQTYVKKVMKMLSAVKAVIWASIGVSGT